MNVIHNKNVENLIIDVRYNRGGSQHPSIYLLQHLMEKSFVYYSKTDLKAKLKRYTVKRLFILQRTGLRERSFS
jgi:C-terminal processing protease CtpA/Prc